MTSTLAEQAADLERMWREAQARKTAQAASLPAVVAPAPLPVVDDSDRAPATVPDWLKEEVKLGLKKLVLLRLDGAPPEDCIRATAAVWLQTFGYRRTWTVPMQPAIREAFVRFCAGYGRFPQGLVKWPAPSEILALFDDLDRPRAALAERKAALPEPSGTFEARKATALREMAYIRELQRYTDWLEAHAGRRVSHFDMLWERIGIAVRHAGDADFWRFLA